MVRRLLFLAFAVALVVGFTLPAAADDYDYNKNKYVLEVDCYCSWGVELYVNNYKLSRFSCYNQEDLKVYFESRHDIKSIVVKAKLQDPRRKLTATCELDKHFRSYGRSNYDDGGDYDPDEPFFGEAGCFNEGCYIHFKAFELDREYERD
jgi:hypothetical protein